MMSMKQKSSGDKCCSSEVCGKVVVVAVKASKDVPRSPLVWALTHVVQPGDCIKLLVLIPSHSTGKKLWGFSRFTSDCTIGHWRSISGMSLDQKDVISDSCSQMMRQLRSVYDPEKIKVYIKVVPGSSHGVVVAEAKKTKSNWVILDRNMKQEKKCCLDELQCNLVVMKRSHPKVLRLNLVGPQKMESEVNFSLPLNLEQSPDYQSCKDSELNSTRGPDVTPTSSPDRDSSITGTDVGTSSLSSSDPGTSPFLFPGSSGNIKTSHPYITEGNETLDESETDADSEKPIKKIWTQDTYSPSRESLGHAVGALPKTNSKALSSTYGTLVGKFSKLKRNSDVGARNHKPDVNLSKTVRNAVSLSRKAPPGPPPLCSVCQHKAPIFGSPPRWFTYAELEVATRGFSESNFLAEGGFGSVHKGVLPGGQVIAVKQHNLASSQGDREFCSEVEVLSCAQHRNVVMLIGFCVEGGKRLLVYEYICNGSLHSHLYGREQDPLVWSARQKVAVGAARGLRYLHEECRVGCIVHRDLRPKNILVTHDFEPLVGDFGLARWQPNGDLGVETRIIGTFGYLAPEYAQSGQITEKADVYSFGIILVELITGRKAMDIKRPKGQQCLSEWARPLLAKFAIDELIDPRLRGYYSQQEVYTMMQCASLCIRRDPNVRPRMSQVLRMLEGAAVINLAGNT